MKKLMPLILTFALAISLAGCGLTDQWNEVRTGYIEPAVEQAKTGVDPKAVDELAIGPNVTTDWSKLTEFETAENIGGRVSSGALEELTASASYGRLLPYIGCVVSDESGAVAGLKYGLITKDGDVALDPVLTFLQLAAYADAAGGEGFLDIYVMGRSVNGEAGETMRYAVCGAKGDWATGFDYEAVYPTELGVICVTNGEGNDAVCYNEAGETLFDTSTMSYNLKAGSVSSMAECGNGWMKVIYTNDQIGFMDSRGYILNNGTNKTSYFDDTLGFHNGLAAVRYGNLWSYIDVNGNYVAYQKFEECTSFMGGVAAGKLSGGNWVVIGTDGKTIKEFEDATGIEVGDGYIAVTNSVGGVTNYSTADMEPLRMYDIPANPYSGGMWIRGEFASRVRTTDGVEVVFSGATELVDHMDNTLFLVKLADESYAVMDTDGRVVMSGEALGFLTDSVTGEICVYDYAEGVVKLYSASGSLMADHAIMDDVLAGEGEAHAALYGPADGCTMCSEGTSIGWKNASNEWIFRVKVAAGD